MFHIMGDLEGSYLRSDINISADTYMTSIYSNYDHNASKIIKVLNNSLVL